MSKQRRRVEGAKGEQDEEKGARINIIYRHLSFILAPLPSFSSSLSSSLFLSLYFCVWFKNLSFPREKKNHTTKQHTRKPKRHEPVWQSRAKLLVATTLSKSEQQ